MDRFMPAKSERKWKDDEGFTEDFAKFNQKGRNAIEQAERELNGDVTRESCYQPNRKLLIPFALKP